MMTLIHHALAPHVYFDSEIKIPPSVKPATLSILYSDVGNFYERCGPSQEEPGWAITGAISTTWKIQSSLASLVEQSYRSFEVELLSEAQVRDLLASDVPDFDQSSTSASSVQFGFPSAPLNVHLVTRSAANPLHKKSPSTSWGAHVVSEGAFITWAFSYSSPSELQITRLKASSETLPALLRAAFEAGKLQGCEIAEAWNVPVHLAGMAGVLGGTTGERNECLSAFRWYGPEATGEIRWLMNEQ
jgi:hypothetical protein